MSGDEPSDLIRSVSRALRVLEEVAQSDRPLTVKVIARRCGLNLSTSYHLVRTLCYEGYLLRLPSGDYLPGPQVAERFHDMLGALGRPPNARAVLGHLAASTGHTAYLARLTEGRLVVAEVAEGLYSPWLEDLQAGLEAAPHATALGKALLVALPPAERRAILEESGLRRFTSRTPATADDVEKELYGLRPGQVVEEHGQYREEVACAAITVPVPTGGDGDCRWTLGISTLGLEIPPWAPSVLREAARDLGGKDP
ncbi:IclR family transcriptional regulator [Nonomuraea sp. ATR24]|uniref:IclR family transcriptional regulator n=1 Tax=Nonomuraea TaxID=83681 RepID=UPI001C5F297F|nr:helix-turn-helix domain-containing protein [Nonomuraea ceibae]